MSEWPIRGGGISIRYRPTIWLQDTHSCGVGEGAGGSGVLEVRVGALTDAADKCFLQSRCLITIHDLVLQ